MGRVNAMLARRLELLAQVCVPSLYWKHTHTWAPHQLILTSVKIYISLPPHVLTTAVLWPTPSPAHTLPPSPHPSAGRVQEVMLPQSPVAPLCHRECCTAMHPVADRVDRAAVGLLPVPRDSFLQQTVPCTPCTQFSWPWLYVALHPMHSTQLALVVCSFTMPSAAHSHAQQWVAAHVLYGSQATAPWPCCPQVEKMARQFGVQEDVSYTCETAGHFWLLHVLSRCAAGAGAGVALHATPQGCCRALEGLSRVPWGMLEIKGDAQLA